MAIEFGGSESESDSEASPSKTIPQTTRLLFKDAIVFTDS
jgi:hypothetical protein